MGPPALPLRSFPTSARRLAAAHRQQTIALEYTPAPATVTAYNKHSLAEISHIAWAVLLRCYTQRHDVSFIAPSSNLTTITHDGSEVLEKGSRSTYTLIRYHLPANLHISQVRPTATQSCGLEEIVRSGKVNTAVIYSACLCNGRMDEAVELPELQEREHCSLSDAVCWAFLSYIAIARDIEPFSVCQRLPYATILCSQLCSLRYVPPRRFSLTGPAS